MRLLRDPMNGFKYAIEGVVHVFRTQRHMRFHFLTMVLVLVVSLLFKLSRDEIIILLFTITLVLAAEMLNTAIEAVVDLVTQTYHPLAKFAKDIAAGAVLITTINALAVGFLLLPGHQRMSMLSQKSDLFHTPSFRVIAVVAFLLLTIMVLMWKVAGGKGKLLKGGVVSGHSAVGFFLATTIMFTKPGIAVSIMAFFLAVLVAQSRVEGGIHTLQEVVIGGILATGVAFIVYAVLAPVLGM